MQIKIKGTRDELEQIFPDWSKLSRLIRVDYYKMHLITNDEVFILTERDFIRVGMLTQPTDSIDESSTNF